MSTLFGRISSSARNASDKYNAESSSVKKGFIEAKYNTQHSREKFVSDLNN